MGILKSVAKTNMSYTGHNHSFIGAPSFAHQNPGSFLDLYEKDSYASIYPSVKAITSEFKQIQPFAIKGNGERVENNNVLNALYHPNQIDSSVAFFEKLAVMNLTHRKTYVLVWRRDGNEAKPGGELTADNIVGFTFLERPAITRRDNRTYYTIGSQEFTDDEVMVIPGGVDPSNLYGGYAPGEASRRWATLEDYVADYQQGFFENGAVPAGQFVITASSETDFDDTVDAMQSKHRGAGKNNNVTYTPRPVDPATGKPADSKIEWIPFASTNREIDFKNLFEQANKRVDSVFGVPASIRGVGENNNYATARLDQQNFIIRAVKPLALAIYTQITHELNRITGGIGVAITFNLPIPAIAQEEKDQAETKVKEVTALNQLIGAGFTLDSVIAALKLDKSYENLKREAPEPQQTDDNADVDDGDEVNDSPDPEKIDGVTPLNKGEANRKNPKDQLQGNEVASFEEELSHTIRENMRRQIDRYIDNNYQNAKGDPEEEETEQFTDEMMVTIIAVMLVAGTLQYFEGSGLIASEGLSTDALTEYTVSKAAQDSYRDYLEKVALSYGEDTAKSIRKILEVADAEGWTADQTKTELKNIMSTDEWRVKRLANTEVNLSQSKGALDSMIQIQDEVDVKLNKIWTHTGGDTPCEFCQTMIDTKIPLEDSFVDEGSTVTGVDGGEFTNKWRDIDTGGLHANCHCLETYEVIR